MARMGKTALVTGCSSGFGALVALGLVERGWTVAATLRGGPERGRELASAAAGKAGSLRVLELEITDPAHRAAAAALVEELGGLDLLVNNAGYGLFGALEDLTEEQLRRQFEVNFFGPALLTKELLPALRRSRGRVINVSSTLGYEGFPLAGAYCASKFALEGLSESLLYELNSHGVQVCVVEPGGFRTRFADNTVWAAGADAPGSPYAAQTRGLKRALARMLEKPGTPPERVARRVVELAEAARMPRRVAIGSDAKAAAWLNALLPDRAVARLLSRVYDRVFLKESA